MVIKLKSEDKTVDGVVVRTLIVRGYLDENPNPLRDAIKKALSDKVSRIVLDLKDARLDALGCGYLTGARGWANAANVSFALLNPSESFKELEREMGMGVPFEIIEEALSH
jgi:anti-anti-sigma regulatory factor